MEFPEKLYYIDNNENGYDLVEINKTNWLFNNSECCSYKYKKHEYLVYADNIFDLGKDINCEFALTKETASELKESLIRQEIYDMYGRIEKLRKILNKDIDDMLINNR